MKIPVLITLVFILTALQGCQKEEIFTLNGSCIGFVQLIDDRGMNVDEKSGVALTLMGTGLSAVTAANGKFVINNIEAGTYDLEYSSPDIGSYRVFSTQFVGGNEPAYLGIRKLYLKPDLELESFATLLSGDRIFIEGEFSEGKDYSIRYYISRDPGVSYLNYEYASGLNSYGNTNTELNTNFYIGLTDYGSGDTIYFAVYLDNPYTNGQYSYLDPVTRERVIPSMTQAWETIAINVP